MIDVALTIDHNYVRYCAVVIASIKCATTDDQVRFHVVGNDLTDSDREVLMSVSDGMTAFYTVPADMLAQYSLLWGKGRLNMTVFYRCMLATLLPPDVHKVIYMDCDVIVVRSLTSLWNTDLDNLAVAGVPDLLHTPDEYFNRLGYDRSYGYFNGGVLLLNLDYWRANNVERRLSDFFNKHRDRVVRNDQDIMNAVLYKEKVLVDYVWNVQIDVFDRISHKTPEGSAHCLRIINDAAIVHFCHKKKPWHYACVHPLKRIFFEAEKHTPFDSLTPISTPKVKRRLFFHNILYTLGLKKQKMLTEKELEQKLSDYRATCSDPHKAH